MASLKIAVTKKGDSVLLSLTGLVDESAAFPKIEFGEAKIAIIVWSGVTLINSCGIREWVKWLGTFPQGVRIAYAHCPRIIVDQINMVDGFLPKGGTTLSFFVPYYCNDCSAVTNLLFTNGKEFTGSNIAAPETVKCSKCGKVAELDVMESKYFKFLKAG